MSNLYNVSSSPHVRNKLTTGSVMLDVALCLLPATVMGIWHFKLQAVMVIALAIISAVLTEYVFDYIAKRGNTVKDCSAVVTGLLLALCLPAGVPFYIPVLGSVFAILVVKCFFGGLGHNFMNPALAGRCFLLLSFSSIVADYTVDGYSSATPLAELAAGNAVHKKLAEWEQQGKLKAVVTQNIDGLHQAAGSKVVYELHGSVHRNYCQKCGAFYDARYMLESTGIPRCEKCGGLIKPDVVLYEEGLDQATINGAVHAISQADVLIIGGTSLTVYPAAGLIDYYNGNKLVLINKSVTPMDSRADLLVQGPIGEIFSQL